MPSTEAGAREVSVYLAENTTGFLVSLFLYGLGMSCFLILAAGLWAYLRRSPGVPEEAAAVFAFGSVALVAIVLAGFAPMSLLAYRAPQAATRELYDLTWSLLAQSGWPTAVALGSYAWIVLRWGALPAWTGWLAVAAAVSHVVIAGTFFFDSGFFSLVGGVIVAIPGLMFIWMAGTSVALARAPARG